MARQTCHAVTAVLLLTAAGWPAIAQVPEEGGVINREYSIKAAFLYHFSTYVEWPADAFPAEGEPFVIGVYQTDPFGTVLQTIAARKTVAGHPIAVKLVKSTSELRGCQILFVPMSVPPQEQRAVVDAARDALVLVVGESDDFVQRGGDVQFFVDGNKVRFAFNAEITTRGDLKVSSKLLSLAKIVPTK